MEAWLSSDDSADLRYGDGMADATEGVVAVVAAANDHVLAASADGLIKGLSLKLAAEFGSGYTGANLRYMLENAIEGNLRMLVVDIEREIVFVLVARAVKASLVSFSF